LFCFTLKWERIVFRLREKKCQLNSFTVDLCQQWTLSRGGVDICCSSDEVFPIRTEKDLRKRLTGEGKTKCRFAIGAIVLSEPGYYLTEEYAKLAALAVYMMN
jgi:hypothetical protein